MWDFFLTRTGIPGEGLCLESARAAHVKPWRRVETTLSLSEDDTTPEPGVTSLDSVTQGMTPEVVPEVTGDDSQPNIQVVNQPRITLAPGDVPIPGGDKGGDLGSEVTEVAVTSSDVTVGDVTGDSVTQADVAQTQGVTESPETVSVGQEEEAATTQSQAEAETASQTADDSSVHSTVAPPTEGAGTASDTEVTTDGATEAVDVEVTTEVVPVVTERQWPAEDPCHPGNHKVLAQDDRHFSQSPQGVQPRSDADLIEGWYGFDYKGEVAIIPTACIKESQCSTIMPYHLKQALNISVGESDRTEMCGPGRVAGEINCCLKPVVITIRNCESRFIYFLHKLSLDSASICTQLPDEDIPYAFLAIPPKQETTTTVPTTPQPTLSWVPHENDDRGIVTVEYTFPAKLQETDFLIEDFDPKFRKMIADALNNMTTPAPPQPTVVIRENDPLPGGAGVKKMLPDQEGPVVPDVDKDAGIQGPEDMRKRRATGSNVYTEDDVKYVGMTPTTTEEVLQVPIYVADPETGRVPTDHMMCALRNLDHSGEISDEVGVEMVRYYEGLPSSIALVGRSTSGGVWDKHRGLLIALIVLISICLLVILIGLCCLRCRKSRGSWSRADDKVSMEAGHAGKKRMMVVENPMPDAEIMRDESPMLERDNPAMTSNGGGGHLSKKDDDNGWVVPIEELTIAEKEKPEVEDTKL